MRFEISFIIFSCQTVDKALKNRMSVGESDLKEKAEELSSKGIKIEEPEGIKSQNLEEIQK